MIGEDFLYLLCVDYLVAFVILKAFSLPPSWTPALCLILFPYIFISISISLHYYKIVKCTWQGIICSGERKRKKEIGEEKSNSAAAASSSGVVSSSVWPTVKPFVNGGAAGMLATCVIQPIDTIKVRIQLGEGSTAEVTKKILRNEGIASFYKVFFLFFEYGKTQLLGHVKCYWEIGKTQRNAS